MTKNCIWRYITREDVFWKKALNNMVRFLNQVFLCWLKKRLSKTDINLCVFIIHLSILFPLIWYHLKMHSTCVTGTEVGRFSFFPVYGVFVFVLFRLLVWWQRCFKSSKENGLFQVINYNCGSHLFYMTFTSSNLSIIEVNCETFLCLGRFWIFMIYFSYSLGVIDPK